MLKTKEWAIRAVTRDIAGTKGKALESDGAEVVYADFEKPETLERAVEVKSTLSCADATILSNFLRLLPGSGSGFWRH